MLNRSASLAMSTSVLKALPGKLDIKVTHLVFSMNNQYHFPRNNWWGGGTIVCVCGGGGQILRQSFVPVLHTGQ